MTLSNIQLEQIASDYRIPLVTISFKDDLKNIKPFHYGGVIVNLQDSKDSLGKQNQGTHYTCFFIDNRKNKKQAIYFDPLGFIPPLEVQNYLQKYIPYRYNIQMIQPPTNDDCGWFCAYCLWFLSHTHGSLDDRFKGFLSLWYYGKDKIHNNISVLHHFWGKKKFFNDN